ncbi:MAG: tail-specific protease [Flavobacterium sp. BFFFF2]|nr:MAG: tail-specific protease [Flavobacterium sp. BFFFF2]
MKIILQFMKRNFKILLLVLAIAIGLWSFMPKFNEGDPEKDKTLIELLTFVLEKGHYSPAVFDDKLSKGVYADYLKGLDPSKRFFLQSDLDEFSKFETVIDDQLLKKDLSFFDLTYARFEQRTQETKAYYTEILSEPFDFDKQESINTDYEKQPYAKSVNDLKDRWRKQIKLSVLSTLVEKQKVEGELAKKAKEQGKTPEAPKSFAELEKAARESTLKSLNETFSVIKDLNRNDWFSVFVNSITAQFDPHTNYFAPDDKERFDTSMSGTLEGIGARLQKKNDFVEITELISGGPAWRGKQLEAGDLVLKVAQGETEPVDVVGMRLDDVVRKIKGPKGTEVRLTVKKSDGTIKVISIIRDQVEIEETYAKSSVVLKNGIKYGLINLPKFYIDFENKDKRDAAKDLTLEVDRLKNEGVEGLIIDLRDNGGGSLKTVVDIAGLFIDQGPVVQVRSSNGNKEVLSDRDPKIQWDGPLVLMVNNFSASASEILAAAMQDYKRAVIIGSRQTFGKGTVQNIIDLNQFVRGSSMGDLGALKTTTQKFYRINGGSTQLEGVHSDVAVPDKFAYVKMGERDLEHPMAWDKIDPATFTPWHKQAELSKAIANSKNRVMKSTPFQLMDDNARWLEQREKENVISLNLNAFKKEQQALEDMSKKFKSLAEYNNQLTFNSLPYEVDAMDKDSVLKEKRSRWHEALKKDIYVEEAVRVLDDLSGHPIVETTAPNQSSKVKS